MSNIDLPNKVFINFNHPWFTRWVLGTEKVIKDYFFVFLKSLKFSIMIWIARSEIFFLFSFPFTPRLIPHRQDFSAGSPPCIVGDAHSRGSRGQCRSLQQLLPQCRSSPSPDPGARREEPVGRWRREPGASPQFRAPYPLPCRRRRTDYNTLHSST